MASIYSQIYKSGHQNYIYIYTYIYKYIYIYIYIYICIYTGGVYHLVISPLSGGQEGGHGDQAGGRMARTGSYLSLLVLLVAQRHSTQHPETLPETLPGSFRKLPELRKTEYLLQASGKASGNLPGASGTAAKRQNHKTSFRQASGNLSGPSGTATTMKMTGPASGNASRNLPDTGNSDFYLLEPTCAMQLVSNNKANVYDCSWYGGL